MKKKTVLLLVGLAMSGFLNVSSAFAMDDTLQQQLGFHFSGVLPATSTGTVSTNFPTPLTGEPMTDQSTRSGGWQASYSYQFNKWTGAEVGYGKYQFTQNYSTDFGASSVQSDLRQGTADFVFHVPVVLSRIHPYGVVGVGALRFMPTDDVNNVADAATQTRSSLVYGGGADIDISRRVGIRAAYRGFRYKAPDFELPELTTNMQTHMGEPSVGVYFRFSGINFGGKAKSGN
jgi:opacity protein-like surface antigen